MKIIGIYLGKFQPPHKGNLTAFKKLQQIVGPEAFVAIDEISPTPEEPLNIGDIEQIWVRQGVPVSHLAKVHDWHHPIEILTRFSPKHTAVVFALSPKEAEKIGQRKSQDEKGKEVWTDVSGKPKYLQPYIGNESTMESFDKHGYVLVVDDKTISNKPVSTRAIKEGLGSPRFTDDQKKKFFTWIFGWFDISLYQLLTDKFKNAYQVSSPSAAPNVEQEPEAEEEPKTVAENKLVQLVNEILKELYGSSSTPQGASMDQGSGDVGADMRADNLAKSKVDANKAKQQAERDLKSLETDLKWKKASVEKLRKDDLPDKRDEIDALNKQMAGGANATISTSTSY